MMMKKLSEEHYIIVDDSEIKEGDWYYLPRTHSVYQCKEDATELNLERDFGVSKVTHSTEPLDKSLFFTDRVWGCERLSLGIVKELLGVVDVEKRAEEKIPNLPYKNYVKIGFIGGYNQALEDNKEKKYTEDDLKKAICIAKDSMGVDNDGETCYSHLSTEQIIQSLQPQTEWEVEMVDGKLKLKS